MLQNLVWGEARHRSVFPMLEFHRALGQPSVADDELVGRPDEVCIVEFHAGSFIAIVPEHFDSGLDQRIVE